MTKTLIFPRYRFDRLGNVVLEQRRPGPTVGTDAYKPGDRLFEPKHCSPARYWFRAQGRKGHG